MAFANNCVQRTTGLISCWCYLKTNQSTTCKSAIIYSGQLAVTLMLGDHDHVGLPETAHATHVCYCNNCFMCAAFSSSNNFLSGDFHWVIPGIVGSVGEWLLMLWWMLQTYHAAENSEEEEEQSDSKSVRISLHKFISMLFKLRTRSHAKCHPLLLLLFRFAAHLRQSQPTYPLSATHLISTTHANATVLWKRILLPRTTVYILVSDIFIIFDHLSSAVYYKV